MNSRTLILIGLLLPGLLVTLPPCAVASATWYVGGVSGSDSNNCLTPSTACGTIGHAISLAASGDSIIVAAGVYPEHLTIAVNLNVIGSGQGTIIDGQGAGRVVYISVATATVTLSNLTIRHGTGGVGAGILNYGSLTLNNTTINGNVASSFGGGIYNSGTLRVINSTLSGNSVSQPCAYPGCQAAGGAIYSRQGAVTISNSTLNNNRAYRSCSPTSLCQSGGGAIFGGASTMIISNSTITGNTAQADCSFCDAYGGGILGGLSVTISNSTLSGNRAVAKPVALGGAIYVSETVIFQNSIVADNPLGGNCSVNAAGTITSKGYNLSSDATCNFNKPGDLNNHDPLLGPLQNNGGPTQTMALLPGSPAIDGGNPSGCSDGQGNLLKTDQRGMPRPDREDTSGCDMGAYESQTD